MKAIFIASLIFGCYLGYSASYKVHFDHQQWRNKPLILLTCYSLLNARTDGNFTSMSIAKDNQIFYNYDNRTGPRKLSCSFCLKNLLILFKKDFIPVCWIGLKQLVYLMPRQIAMVNITKNTTGLYNCSIWINRMYQNSTRF